MEITVILWTHEELKSLIVTNVRRFDWHIFCEIHSIQKTRSLLKSGNQRLD